MDFQTAPVIREALRRRVEHGVFGYSIVPPEWNQAYVDWWGRRHGLAIDPDSLVFCTGVVPAISSMVRKLTTPNENV
nr:aminotransferase [Eggerthella lenta]